MTYLIKITQGMVSHIEANSESELCAKVREKHGHCYFRVIAVINGKSVSRAKVLVA